MAERPISKHEAAGTAYFSVGWPYLFGAGFCLVFSIVGFFIPAKEGPVVAYTIGGIAGTLALACFAGSIVAYMMCVKYVALYEDRIVWRDASGEHEAEWDDITDVWRTEILVNGSVSVRQVVIKAHGKKSAPFKFILNKWKQMADHIQEESSSRLASEYHAEYDRGESVRFGGKLSLSQDGINIKGKQLDWDQVRSTSIQNGHLCVNAGRNGEHEVALGDLPNTLVLLGLLQRTPVPPK